MHHQVVQAVGESIRGDQPAKIFYGDEFESFHVAAVWRHDPERKDVVAGGVMLKARLIFTIRKEIQPSPFEDGEVIRCDITGHQAFLIDTISQTTTDHVAWKYEARRSPGSDPTHL